MRYELFIGLRYLRAKRAEAFISLITVISMLGVMIGVMTLNIALAIMTGFEVDLRDRILGFNPHVVVVSYSGSLPDGSNLAEKIRAVDGVVAAAPFVYGQVMVSNQQFVSGVVVRGIGAGSPAALDVARFLDLGSLDELDKKHDAPATDGTMGRVELPGVIIGKELQRQLNVNVGDPINVISPLGTPSPVGMVPRVKRHVVVGIFSSGMAEYDATLIYMSLADAQKFFDLGDGVTGVEVRTDDLYHARDVGTRLNETLGFPYRARDWMETNENLFTALRLEKTVYFIVLSLMITVAAFSIVATLIMVVMEKRKDIAILKSMGATRRSVGRIFILKGLIIGVFGTLLGDVLGYLACTALAYGIFPLPPGVFFTDTLPVKMYPEYFAMVTVASVAICLLATIYPARQAAALAPVDVIRYG
jgi:lipoprotein-releasing system permease protein